MVAFVLGILLKRALPKQFKGQSQQDADELFQPVARCSRAESAHQQQLQISPLQLMAAALTTQGGDGCGTTSGSAGYATWEILAMLQALASVHLFAMSMAASESVAGEVLEEWGYRRLPNCSRRYRRVVSPIA